MSLPTALVIFCAQYLIWVEVAVFATVIFFDFRRSGKRLLVISLISIPVAYIVGKIVGFFWYDPRPFVETHIMPLVPHAATNGFPSDHALMAFTIASLVVFYNRKLGAIFWILASFVALGRVLAGVHHTIDVVAGAIIGACVVALITRAERYLIREKKETISQSL